MITVTCYTLDLERIDVELNNNPKVIDLKKKLASLKNVDITDITLVHNGIVLKYLYSNLDIEIDKNNKLIAMINKKEEYNNQSDNVCMCSICSEHTDDYNSDQEPDLELDQESDQELDQESDDELDHESDHELVHARPIYIINHDDLENDIPPTQLTELDRQNIADIVLTCQVSLPIAISYYLAGNRDKNLACSLIFDSLN
jgi:hypothetical protein